MCIRDRDSQLHYLLKTLLLTCIAAAITGTWLDYSFLAVSLVVAFSLRFRVQKGTPIAFCAAGALVIVFSVLYSNFIELYALAALPILLWVEMEAEKRGKTLKIPKWVGYVFYPVHLSLLIAIKFIV